MKKLLFAIVGAVAILTGPAAAQAPSGYPYVFPYQNDPTTGTTQFTLTKIVSTGAVIMGSSDANGYVGVCVANCGTTGTAWIAFAGEVPIKVDGSTTFGHYLIQSATVSGDGLDSGATTYPTSGVVVGKVHQASTGAGTLSQVDIIPEIKVNAGTVASVNGATGTVSLHDLDTSGNVKGVNGVPLCTGFTPTDGQALKYTTGSSPNPCYTAAVAGGFSGFPPNAQTANYTVSSGDFSAPCKIIPMTSASATTVTLLATAPTLGQCIMVDNAGAGNVDISRNGLTIDGAAADVFLVQGEGVTIVSDGTNYITNRGIVPPLTFFQPSTDTSSNNGPAASQIMLWGVYFPQKTLFSNLAMDWAAADASSNRYAYCAYLPSGALFATSGTLPQITATGVVEQATTTANILMPPGRYYIGFTGGGTSLTGKIATGAAVVWTDMNGGVVASGGGTTCPSSVTLPSHSSFALGRQPWFVAR